jgi:hypothetical protein
MGRPRHPNKHIERAVCYAESLGWRVEISNGHAWGHLLCPNSTREGCIVGVWSTPKNPENHARRITRDVDSCPHRNDLNESGEEREHDH